MADLGAYNEPVGFSDGDAQALMTASTNAANAVDAQAGSRASARATGEDQFQGYFSTLFASNGETQVKDASELSSALRALATLTGELQKAADAERARRAKAKQWEEQQKHKSWLDSAVDDVKSAFGAGDTPPVGPPAPQLHPVAAKPPVGTRNTPAPGSGGGSASSGVSSAIPDNLKSFATQTTSDDTTLSSAQSTLTKAYQAFVASCHWGSLDGSGVLSGFGEFISGNAQEAAWANVVAAAFEQAGGSGSVCTLSNAAISAALASANVSATRQDITIDMPTVKGGLVTSGYADDPVNTATGNFIEPEVDLAFDGACSALIFTRMYNSVDPAPGGFGPGWSSWTEAGLALAAESARWTQADGRVVVFPRLDDGWDRASGGSYWLTRDDEQLVVSDNSGGRWRFDASGRPVSFDRGAGTRVDLMYADDGRLAGMVHERGRSIALDWADGRVSRITASDGRSVSYGYDERGRLVTAAGLVGERRYVWGEQSGLVEQVIDGDGVVMVLNGYDDERRVAWQRSPFGRVSRYTYLPGGVTEVADTDGERSNTWIADGLCRLIGVIDSHGDRQSYVWDAYGDMIEATDRLGRKTVREYDQRGRLVRSSTETGANLQYGYDDLDRLTTTVAGPADGDGPDAVTEFRYEGADRNPSVLVDPSGGVTTMVWSDGLLTRLEDPTGVVLRFEYDRHGELIATTNAVGDTARLERDDAGRVTAAVTPSGNRTVYAYDETGVLVSRRDPDGGVWRFEHTAAGRLTAQIAPDGGRTEIEYGPTGDRTRTIDPLGRVTARTTDDLGNLASVQLPDGSTWSYAHDSLSRLMEVVDPTGGAWSYRYDADGDLVETTDPTGATRSATVDEAGNAVTIDDGLLASTVRLDALGRPQAVQSGGDGTQTYVYDPCGRVVEILDAEGGLTLIARDAAGRPVTFTDPTGVVTEYAYDACGRLSRVVAADGGVTSREYDADSRLVRQLLPDGGAAWARYDSCGRLVQVHQPGMGTATYAYDTCGRVTSAVDIRWGTRRFAYDQAGQLVSVTNGLGGVTRFDYDDNGRVVRITDPAGGVSHQAWDGMGRLVSRTDPLGRTMRSGYDAAGRQTWQEEPDGHRLSFGYDASGRDVSVQADGRTIWTIGRDLAGRTQTIHDDTAAVPVTHVRAWDRLGRLIRDTRAEGDGEPRGLAWEYDAAGRRLSMTDAFGRTTRYHYDAAGRLERVDHPALGEVVLGYDAAGQLVTATATDSGGQRIAQQWRWADGAIVSHSSTGGAGAATTTIDRDDDGRIRSISRDDVVTRYGYDAAGQLTEAITDGVAQAWTFDANGRLTRHDAGDSAETYAYDAAGQLLTVVAAAGTTSHSYDLAGRRTRTENPDGATREYEWTATGWLSRVTDTDAAGRVSATALHTDALGRLSQAGGSSVWWDAASPVPTLAGIDATTVLPLGPVTGVAGQWATPGWRTVRPDLDDPWSTVAAIALPRGLGLTPTGTLTFGAAGGFAPLEWLGVRAYDPSTDAFLSTDPLAPVLGAGWAANPYSYAGNNPLAFSDPTGLHPLTDAQLKAQTQGWLSKAWNATTNWVSHNWEYIVAGVAIAGGIALMCTGVGGPAGIALMAASGALIAGGADTAIQKFTTGKVNWGQVAISATIGAATGGAGAWAAGASAGANGATALMYSVGLNGGIGAAGSEATYVATNYDHLTWGGAAGAAAGGGIAGMVAGGAGPAGGTLAKEVFSESATGAASKLLTAGINAGGSAGGDIVNQEISHPGQPIDWAHVGIAGGAGGVTSLGMSNASKIPGADRVAPDPQGMSTLKQASHFGVRSNDGLFNFAGRNTRAMWGGGAIGGIVGAAESPGVDALSKTLSGH